MKGFFELVEYLGVVIVLVLGKGGRTYDFRVLGLSILVFSFRYRGGRRKLEEIGVSRIGFVFEKEEFFFCFVFRCLLFVFEFGFAGR